eukprot:1213-Heterococcus_DN1.PRE.1
MQAPGKSLQNLCVVTTLGECPRALTALSAAMLAMLCSVPVVTLCDGVAARSMIATAVAAGHCSACKASQSSASLPTAITRTSDSRALYAGSSGLAPAVPTPVPSQTASATPGRVRSMFASSGAHSTDETPGITTGSTP